MLFIYFMIGCGKILLTTAKKAWIVQKQMNPQGLFVSSFILSCSELPKTSLNAINKCPYLCACKILCFSEKRSFKVEVFGTPVCSTFCSTKGGREPHFFTLFCFSLLWCHQESIFFILFNRKN